VAGERLRIGLLSTANINRLLLAAARESNEIEFLAVASRDPARAQAYAAEHGLERAYGTYDDLLGDPDLDAVYVSLPNSLHVEWSIRALEAGKHVLCEKPFGRDPKAVAAAFDAADRAGKILMEAFMYRHHPQTKRVAELVRDGAIGALRHVRSILTFPLRDSVNVRLSPELEGGSLMDIGCYCVSGSRLLAGEPEQVWAAELPAESGVDLACSGTLLFPAGVVAQFHSSFVAPRRQDLEALGEDGSLRVTAPWRQDWGGTVELRRDGEVEHVGVPEADAYRLELENLSRAARREEEPLLGRADAVSQARVLEALTRSARSAAPVAL
jgi:D-xylose 1-dehydrogenase (NADP+, D-xylono-1,5-lactone-forming)